MSGDLVAFLRARLGEDEQAARDAGGKAWKWEQHYGDMCNDPTCEYGELATDDAVLMNVHAYDIRSPWQGAAHIERHHPKRILAEIDAKRQLLAEYEQAARYAKTTWGQSSADQSRARTLGKVVRLIALPYADRPGYREEWRP